MERILNQMAKLVIGLHEQGYNDDFDLHGEDQLRDVQENRSYVFDEININKICQIGGQERKAKKFILAIETADGCKGLLICSSMIGDLFKQKEVWLNNGIKAITSDTM